MDITIAFTSEQLAAIQSLAGESNTQAKTSLAAGEYAAKVILGVVNARVHALFDQSVKLLADAAAKLKHATSVALTAQVQALIATAS